jgi:hypothetical protein
MNRFRTFVIAGALLTLSAIASGCTTSNERYDYGEDTSLNPACAGGFRPSNNRPCSY